MDGWILKVTDCEKVQQGEAVMVTHSEKVQQGFEGARFSHHISSEVLDVPHLITITIHLKSWTFCT
jgi:hypothetical protein